MGAQKEQNPDRERYVHETTEKFFESTHPLKYTEAYNETQGGDHQPCLLFIRSKKTPVECRKVIQSTPDQHVQSSQKQ